MKVCPTQCSRAHPPITAAICSPPRRVHPGERSRSKQTEKRRRHLGTQRSACRKTFLVQEMHALRNSRRRTQQQRHHVASNGVCSAFQERTQQCLHVISRRKRSTYVLSNAENGASPIYNAWYPGGLRGEQKTILFSTAANNGRARCLKAAVEVKAHTHPSPKRSTCSNACSVAITIEFEAGNVTWNE